MLVIGGGGGSGEGASGGAARGGRVRAPERRESLIVGSDEQEKEFLPSGFWERVKSLGDEKNNVFPLYCLYTRASISPGIPKISISQEKSGHGGSQTWRNLSSVAESCRRSDEVAEE